MAEVDCKVFLLRASLLRWDICGMKQTRPPGHSTLPKCRRKQLCGGASKCQDSVAFEPQICPSSPPTSTLPRALPFLGNRLFPKKSGFVCSLFNSLFWDMALEISVGAPWTLTYIYSSNTWKYPIEIRV